MAEPEWDTTPSVRRRMSNTRSRDTSLELKLRRELTALGVRYRLQRKPEADLCHRADFVFIGARLIVDLRGCYWHACPVHATWPKTNSDRWRAKLLRNRERDDVIVGELTRRGWTVVVVWEHDDLEEAAQRIADRVRLRTTLRSAASRAVTPTPTAACEET